MAWTAYLLRDAQGQLIAADDCPAVRGELGSVSRTKATFSSPVTHPGVAPQGLALRARGDGPDSANTGRVRSGVSTPAFILGLSFALFWPIIGFVALMRPVRTSFAFAVVSIVGLAAVLSGATIVFIYVHDPVRGLTQTGQFWESMLGTLAAAIVFYDGAVAYRRRQGTDLCVRLQQDPRSDA
jgi:hypothetical protein